MRLTRYTHACVRLESDGRVLVIDPGIFSEDAALDDATGVLITHEHFDHVVAEKLAGRDLAVYAPAGVVEQLGAQGVAAQAVTAGDAFAAAGFAIRAVGGEHAEIFGGVPGCANIGYVVDENVYHPGDSVFVPDVPCSTLLVPVAGPWLKLAEAIEFVRAVKPDRAYPIHDAIMTTAGQEMNDNFVRQFGETNYARLAVGASAEV
jgi:L-ascorbate metabolism protein UlaG (beta-lactamase superfamily)